MQDTNWTKVLRRVYNHPAEKKKGVINMTLQGRDNRRIYRPLGIFDGILYEFDEFEVDGDGNETTIGKVTFTRDEVKKLDNGKEFIEVTDAIRNEELVEVWIIKNGIGLHTDRIEGGEISDLYDKDLVDYQYMTEEEYDRTILANSDIRADFEEWYGDKDAEVLIVSLR